MLRRLRAAAIVLALAVATVAVLTAGVTLIAAQIEAGNGCGVGLAAPCPQEGMP